MWVIILFVVLAIGYTLCGDTSGLEMIGKVILFIALFLIIGSIIVYAPWLILIGIAILCIVALCNK